MTCWENRSDDAGHEANFLRLDCSRLKTTFGWRPRWDIEKAVANTVEWTKKYFEKGDVVQVMDRQIDDYLGEAHV